MIRIALRAVALAAALAGAAQAQEAAVTRRATPVRESPAEGARQLVWLPAQAPVTRGEQRQGPWVQVRTGDGTTGWVRLFDIEPASGAPAASGGNVVGGVLRGATQLFGSSKPAQAATTAGIRGLGAEDIAQARPDPGAVSQMERLRQTEFDARAFAAAAALRPVAIAPMPAPAAPAGIPVVPAGVPVAPATSPFTPPAADPGQPQSP